MIGMDVDQTVPSITLLAHKAYAFKMTIISFNKLANKGFSVEERPSFKKIYYSIRMALLKKSPITKKLSSSQ